MGHKKHRDLEVHPDKQYRGLPIQHSGAVSHNPTGQMKYSESSAGRMSAIDRALDRMYRGYNPR
jgi:hypothetical protein